MSASEIAARIRERVNRGILPGDNPERIYAGDGERLRSDGCDEPNSPAHVEYEFDSAGGTRIRGHAGCAAVLQVEQQRRSWPYQSTRSATRPAVDIVDDDASVAETLQLLLAAYGFSGQTFASAEAFLESKPRDRQTACLLLDVHLTGMSGFELHERLRALGLSIPTVFMSGRDDGPTREGARRAGAIACLFKPFDNEVLIAALRQVTGGQ